MVRETTASETFIGKTLIDLKESGGEMGCGEYCECCAGRNCDNCSIQKAFDKLGQYEDTGLEPSEIAAMQEQLQAYKQAEQDGKIIKLPCKVGDTIYVHGLMRTIHKAQVINVMADFMIVIFIYESTGLRDCSYFDDFGKTVFLTQEEAEKAGDYALCESGFLDGRPVSCYTCISCLDSWLEESGQVDTEEECEPNDKS